MDPAERPASRWTDDRPRRLRGLRPRSGRARFYDAVFFALGGRRMHESEHAIAYGINEPDGLDRRPRPRARPRLRPPGAARQRQGGGRRRPPGRARQRRQDDGPPGQRPQYGRRYYAAYLRDPDGLASRWCHSVGPPRPRDHRTSGALGSLGSPPAGGPPCALRSGPGGRPRNSAVGVVLCHDERET